MNFENRRTATVHSGAVDRNGVITLDCGTRGDKWESSKRELSCVRCTAVATTAVRHIEAVHIGGTALGKTAATRHMAYARLIGDTGEWRVYADDERDAERYRNEPVGIVSYDPTYGGGWYAREYHEYPSSYATRLVWPDSAPTTDEQWDAVVRERAARFPGFLAAVTTLLGGLPGPYGPRGGSFWNYYRLTVKP